MLASSGSLVAAYAVFGIIGYVLVAFAYYGIFKKSGQPAWGAFVPIVNIYFLLKTVQRPGWWLILFLIPCVSVIIYLVVVWDLSTAFGHGIGFFLGLFFLSIIFLYILGYGSSQYQGRPGAMGGGYAPPMAPPPPA